MAVYVDEVLCKSCNLCVLQCPKGVLELTHQVNSKGYNYVAPVREAQCNGCGICQRICPDFAIFVQR